MTIGSKHMIEPDDDHSDNMHKVWFPEGIAVDLTGNIYVADTYNERLLKFDSRGATSDGYVLMPEITVPEDTMSVTIDRYGTVSIVRAGVTTSEEIGTIELTKFINPAGLRSIGDNLFKETDASGDPDPGNPGVRAFRGLGIADSGT